MKLYSLFEVSVRIIIVLSTTFLLLIEKSAANVNQESPHRIIREAMKKAGAFSEKSTLTIRTKRLNFNKWQNYRFEKPSPYHDDAFGSFDFQKKQYYFKTTGRYGGGYVFEFANIGSDTIRYTYDISGSRNGKVITVGNRAAMEQGFHFVDFFLPYFLLEAVLQSKDSLSIQKKFRGNKIVSRYTRSGKTEYYFDSTGTILSQTISSQPGIETITTYDDYIKKDKIFYPRQITVKVNGEILTRDRIVELSVTIPFNEKLLQLPEDYVLSKTAIASMNVEKIAPDVYVIKNVAGNRNIMFVNLHDGIFVTESPLNSETTAGIIALIKKTIPNKSIRFVHVSHFHNDHSNGIRTFIQDGAEVVTCPYNVKPLQQIINDTSGRFKDELQLSRKAASFIPVRMKKVMGDENHRIEIYEFKNGHVMGMSFVYLPKEKILYQGDLYSLPDDGTITPAIQITKDFYKFLRKNKIQPERIIGHHGHANIPMKVIDQAIKMAK